MSGYLFTPASRAVHITDTDALDNNFTASEMNWTLRAFGNTLRGVAWSGTLYSAVGLDGAVQTSPDGVVWTARVSGTTANLQSVTWLEDHFIAVGSIGGESDGTILTSPDGVVWTEQAPATTNGGIYDVACSDTRCVAVGSIGQVQTTP
jgi:hypothetical protein